MSAQRKYIPDLLIMTRDTDPDLRFMALIDLERELTIPTGPIQSNGHSYGNISPHLASSYANVLLKCLDDEFAEVRTQSLKSFSILPWILDIEIINIIKELVGKKRVKESITSTIYTMALHNLIMNLPSSLGLNQSVINCILPRVLNFKENGDVDIGVDGVEILSDVVQYCGKFMTKEQAANVLNYLADVIFHGDNLLAKKAVHITHVMVSKVENKQENTFVVNEFFRKVMSNYHQNSGGGDSKEFNVKLLTLIAATVSGNPTLMESKLNDFWEIICQNLDMKSLKIVDDDFEVQQSKDDVRYEALVAMSRMFQSCKLESIEKFQKDALRGLPNLIEYDPYSKYIDNDNKYIRILNEINSNVLNGDLENIEKLVQEKDDTDDDDEINDNNGSDVESFGNMDSDSYSDYDDFEDDDDDYEDCSWKVRCEAVALLDVIMTKNPLALPDCIEYNFSSLMKCFITDRTPSVQSNIIKVLAFIFESSLDDGAYYCLKELKHVDGLSNSENSEPCYDPAQFLLSSKGKILYLTYKYLQNGFVSLESSTLTVFIKMLTFMVYALNGYGAYFSHLFTVELLKFPHNLLFEAGISSFFIALLSCCSDNDLDIESSLQIHEYIKFSFSNESNHKMVLDGIMVADRFFIWSQSMSDVDYVLMKDVADEVSRILVKKVGDKHLSTEIRQKALEALVNATNGITFSEETRKEFMDVLSEIISNEVLSFSAMKSIKMLKNLGDLENDWTEKIFSSVLKYVQISELSLTALEVLETLFFKNLISLQNSELAFSEILRLHKDKKINNGNANLIGSILLAITEKVNFANNLAHVVIVVADLISCDLLGITALQIIQQLLTQVDDQTLESEIKKTGNPSSPQVCNMLAVLAVASSNEGEIRRAINDLNNPGLAYVALCFLNQVAKYADFGIKIEVLFKFFDCTDSNIVTIAIKTIATLVSEYPDEYLTRFIECMKKTTNLKPVFTTLAFILRDIHTIDSEKQTEILDIILAAQSSCEKSDLNHLDFDDASKCLAELVKMGNCIGKLTEILKELTEENKLLLATVGDVVKYFFNEEEQYSVDWITYLELCVTKFLWAKDLTLKQIGISNLIIILDKAPNLAIPLIGQNFDQIIETEVKPNKEFIHTQQIGPYKHKIDDGLTYRKQVFDLIYYLLKSLQDNPKLEILSNISWEKHFNRFFDYGMKDDQTISSVCLLATLRLFELDPYFFSKNYEGIDTFESFVTRCRKTLNKKLADNAVKQDIEKQNNIIKMTVRFLNKVNLMVESKSLTLSGGQLSEWSTFITSTKSKFSSFISDD